MRYLLIKDCEMSLTEPSNIQAYKFCRVPSGVRSKPFLLAATVQTRLEKYNTEIAEQIKNIIYDDN